MSLEITYLGHASFLVSINDTKLLFDPFISENPLAKNINVQDIRCDYLVLSHAHHDHVADLPVILKSNPEAIVVANFEIINYLLAQNVINNYQYLGFGGSLTEKDFTLQMTPAIHTSSFADGTYGGCAAGFLIKNDKKCLYYGGDTTVFSDMQFLADGQPIDLAILPIGGTFTMGPKDAVKSAAYLNADQVMGVHYNTFPAIQIDTRLAQQLFSDKGKTLLLPKIGESLQLA